MFNEWEKTILLFAKPQVGTESQNALHAVQIVSYSIESDEELIPSAVSKRPKVMKSVP